MMVPVPLSVAPDAPSHESQVSAQNDVFVGEFGARDCRHHVEGGDVAQEFGVGVEADAGALAALGQPEHQRVVLAGEVDRGDFAGLGREDLVDAPAVGPAAGEEAERAGFLESLRAAAAEPPLGLAEPLLAGLIAGLGHALEGLGRGVVLPGLVLTAGRLREGGGHELALDRGKPRRELLGAGHRGQHDHLALDGAVGARAPRQNHPFEAAHPGLDQVDVGDAAVPTGPGAVLLALDGDSPALVVGDEPVGGARVGGGAHQAGADRVEQGLGEGEGLAAGAHALGPHGLDDGVVGGEGLGGGGGEGEGDGAAESDCRRGEHFESDGGGHWSFGGAEGYAERLPTGCGGKASRCLTCRKSALVRREETCHSRTRFQEFRARGGRNQSPMAVTTPIWSVRPSGSRPTRQAPAAGNQPARERRNGNRKPVVARQAGPSQAAESPFVARCRPCRRRANAGTSRCPTGMDRPRRRHRRTGSDPTSWTLVTVSDSK